MNFPIFPRALARVMGVMALALGVSAAFVGTALKAETLAETATRFGARQSVSDIALSPDGTRILYVNPGQKSDERVIVYDLTGDAPPKSIISFNEPSARLSGCSWANEDRIVCEVYGLKKAGDLILYFTRMVSFRADGSDAKVISPNNDWKTLGIAQSGGRVLALDVPGEPDRVLMTRRYFKQRSEKTRLFNDAEGLGVDLVDITSGRSKNVEKPNKMAVNYIADENARVRIMTVRDDATRGFDGSDLRYLYRAAGSDNWEPLSSLDAGSDLARGFIPVAVDAGKNLVYGFERVDGFLGLYSFALDGTGRREQILQRDDVDVDGLVRIGRKRRVIGASYATEKREVVYFDKELDALAIGLAKALPDRPLISILDASSDESKILLAASSDSDPGVIYLYDKGSRRLEELLPVREELFGRMMGKVTPVTFPARDGTEIPAYLTLPPGAEPKNLPAVVLPHGGPESRDEWGFDWLAQFFVARGYAVLQPNFRGSAGYGEAWFGRNGYKSWPIAIGDVNDAGRWLVAQGIADPNRIAIAGWSYGGYAALQSQVADPELFKAVVAIAPVSDLGLLIEESRGYTSYVDQKRRVGSGPHIQSGSPARHASAFKAPVLLVHGTMDLNVSVEHSRLMKSRLESAGKRVEYREFDGLDHGLVHSQARAIMLKQIGEFLDRELQR